MLALKIECGANAPGSPFVLRIHASSGTGRPIDGDSEPEGVESDYWVFPHPLVSLPGARPRQGVVDEPSEVWNHGFGRCAWRFGMGDRCREPEPADRRKALGSEDTRL